jgi:hypothetical protein
MISSSKRGSFCVDGVTGKIEVSLLGLLLCIEDTRDEVVVYSNSVVDEGEMSAICGVCGDVGGLMESRDVGARSKKLHSRLFLSQFAHDGCFTSHYDCD